MALRSGSVQLALCAMLIGTASAWALAPHDQVGGPSQKQLVNKHAEAAQNGGVPSTDEHGTTDRPLIVKTIAPEKTPQETAGDARERKHKDRVERIGLFAGVITATFAAVQTIVFAFQALIFGRQAKSLRDTIQTMERVGTKQSDDMQASIAAAQAAAEAGDRSANLARLALEATETPYLVPIVTKFVDGEDDAPSSPSSIPLGSYRFENCGRSPAIILEERVDKHATASTPNPVYWPFLNTDLHHTSILPKGRKSAKTYITQGMFDGWTPADQTRVAMIVGAVRYADVFGNQFITGFCFYRNGMHGHWVGTGSTTHHFRRKLEGDDLRRARQRDSLTGPGAGHGFGDPEPENTL